MDNQQVLSGKRIFVIEDDVTNMAIIATVLRRQGAVVVQDPWNTNTVNLLKQYLPLDVILLDLMLRRGESGYDIFAKIQAEPDLAEIPIVLVSASDPAVEIPRAKALGVAGYISKPINHMIFPDQVAQCMAHVPLWDTGR